MYKLDVADHYSPARMEFDKLVDKLNEEEFKVVTQYVENLLLAGIKTTEKTAPKANKVGQAWRKSV